MNTNNIIGKCFWLGEKWEFLIYITNEKNLLLWHRKKTISQDKSLLLFNLLRAY